jgi:hypothetical protein
MTQDVFNILTLVISVIGGICGIAGIIISILAFLHTKKEEKFKFVIQIFTDFLNNATLLETFRLLEQDKFQYASADDIAKQKIYVLVSHFSLLSVARNNKLLKLSDISPLEYYLRIIGENPDVEQLLDDYLERIKFRQIDQYPFMSFRILSNKLSEGKLPLIEYDGPPCDICEYSLENTCIKHGCKRGFTFKARNIHQNSVPHRTKQTYNQ